MRGPAASFLRELHRGGGKLGVGNDAVGDAERERLCGVERLGGEIKLARLAGADQL